MAHYVRLRCVKLRYAKLRNHKFLNIFKPMKSPFSFGELAASRHFINRESELERLRVNFRGQVNTIVISPRRWGKTSLVYAAGKRAATSDLKICHINMQRAHSEQEFFEMYLKAVLKATTGRMREVWNIAGELLERIRPAISVMSGGSDFDLKLEWTDIERSHDEILELPNRIAERKKIKLMVCIDEFQDIMEFENSLQMQRSFRAIWQHHKNVGYCLYGSKKHMMYELFEESHRPFYRFGDVIHLGKIDEEYWVPYIKRSFTLTQKTISEELAREIARLMDEHPYFVQYFAHIVWTLTEKKATEETLAEAKQEIFNQHIYYFDLIIDQLTKRQVALLRALIEGEQNLTSQETIKKYNLGSPSTVTTSRKALIQKEILDTERGELYFQDPPFRLWLRDVFFA